MWKDEYNCGHPVIDGHHRYIFSIAKRLMGRSDFSDVVADGNLLLRTVEYHFNVEEQIMTERGFDDIVEHKRQHEAVMLRLKELWLSCNAANFREVVQQTWDWVEGHIVVGDLDLQEDSRIKLY